MGFKASMIVIKSPSMAKIEDEWLLERLGFSDYSFSEETTLDDAMYPRDGSICIGEYNNCIILCDDYAFTDSLDLLRGPVHLLTSHERQLCEIFPDSEILSVACHSVVNYHMYSLVLNGKKLRYKRVADGVEKTEYGDLLAEEIPIYAKSKYVEGKLMFQSEYDDTEEYEYIEDQLMEEFAFGVAARHLGFRMDEGDELLSIQLRKYKGKAAGPAPAPAAPGTPQKGSWLSRLFGKGR